MRKILLLLALLAGFAAGASGWQTDVLGAPFEMRYIDQGTDYGGPVRCTVVRLAPAVDTGVGVLYVHGFNDYFFQAEMASRFAERGYAFYAVDLRRYGRSLLPGQTPFEVRDLREYFADIDSALCCMAADGVRQVVLMGHSTGGLITALYMSERPVGTISNLVLNSPFLDWNQSKLQEHILIPAVRTLSPLMRGLKIPQGASDTYSRSLLRRYGGEWDYDTVWKMPHSPAVSAAWLAAIDEAQDVVQNFPKIPVPVLVMHSDRSMRKGDPASAAASSDVVLDVADIRRYGARLGPLVSVVEVRGGLHDLMLSRPVVRQALYTYIFDYLAPYTGI